MSVAALWLRAALALGVVLLGLWALQYLLRCIARGTGRWRTTRGVLETIETLPLGQSALLHVVRIADHYFALGAAQGHITVICEIAKENVSTR